MISQKQHSKHQLRYHPLGGSYPQIYTASHHQAPHRYSRFGIKRSHYEDTDNEEESFSQSTMMTQAMATHPANFQIRHRSTDKTRGLRHFAHKVCEKVKEKGQTNYNEVADELVTEYFDQLVEFPQDPEKYQYDVRNIRRRVYDALNVLMAMNIIEKEKKEIRWVGLPTSSLAECRRLEEEKIQRQERIRQKTEQLQELIVQLVAYKSLVQRNREHERNQGRPPNSAILYLPYIIVSTDKKTMVECAIAPDKSEYWFNFDRPFEIHDDIEVLKRLGLAYGVDQGEVQPEKVPHIKACLPPALRDYVDQILEGTLTNRKIKNTVFQTGPSLVKLDPNSGPRIRTASSDSIVVKATRANLSGVAPSGDGGPMGSFLGPMNNPAQSQQVAAHHPNQSVARYTVIPRPISARYSSPSAIHSRSSLPISQHYEHQQQYQPTHSGQHRLGGVLHYEVPIHPLRDPTITSHQCQSRETYLEGEQQQMLQTTYQLETGYAAEEYIDEQIVEEEVVSSEQP